MNNYVVDCNVLRKNDRIRSEVDIYVVLESDFDAMEKERDTALSQLAALREELAKFDEGMRALACSLGAGGYNAETLTADQLVGKVQWGIDNIISVQEQRLADAERRNSELIELLRRVDMTPLDSWYSSGLNVAVFAAIQPTESGASE